MSKPKFTPYVDSLTEAMKLCMDNPSTIFIGQQIVYYGNPMSKTIEGLPKERMIETPVMEETQMGMTMGLAMTGHQVVTFYPRWDLIWGFVKNFRNLWVQSKLWRDPYNSCTP